LIFSASPIIGESRTESSIEAKDHKERFRRALASINQWLRQERNARKLPEIWQAIGQSCVDISTLGSPTTVVRYTALNGRYTLLLKWLNRRSQRRSFTWEGSVAIKHGIRSNRVVWSLYPV